MPVTGSVANELDDVEKKAKAVDAIEALNHI